MTPEDRKKIIEAAQAIVDRWDSPAWKYGDPHTGVLIRDLERAIAPLRAEPETREPKVMSNEEIERIAEALCASMDAYTDWEDRHGYKQTGIRFLTYACDNNLFAPLDRSRMEEALFMKVIRAGDHMDRVLNESPTGLKEIEASAIWSRVSKDLLSALAKK